MEILALYDDITKIYVENVVLHLESLGYTTKLQHINNYSGAYLYKSTPTLLISKSGKDAYALQGKQPLDIIVNWARNSGAQIA